MIQMQISQNFTIRFKFSKIKITICKRRLFATNGRWRLSLIWRMSLQAWKLL